MSIDVTPALIGLSGVVIGGILQASVQLWLARSDHVRKLKAQAYLTFFQGLAETSYAQTKEQMDAANARLTEGRSLVALYGSEKAIEAMAISFRLGGNLHDEGAWQVHADMIKEMREDTSGQKFRAESRLIFEVLYGAKGREK